MSSAAIIRTASVITGIILLATCAVLFSPWLLGLIAASHLNSLSNFGQFISGVFAPIAFVWLAVAVLLQSRELELQRIELKDTREVFELQKEEMKRAADENREQTRIMTENLRSESERQIYSECDILLYALALYVTSNRDKSHIQNYGTIVQIHVETINSIDKNNSDIVYPLLRRNFERFLEWSNGRPQLLSEDCGKFLDYCRVHMAALCEGEAFKQNRLAMTRFESLGLPSTLSLLRSIKPS